MKTPLSLFALSLLIVLACTLASAQADNVSTSPSTVPPTWNPFGDQGFKFVRNPDLPLTTDLWNLMGTGPTPSSGGGAATATAAGASLAVPNK